MHPSSRIFLAAAALCAASAHATPPFASQTFTLDSASFYGTYAMGFCGKGQVAGQTLLSDWTYAAFVTNAAGEIQTFKVPGAVYTDPKGCYRSRLMGYALVNNVPSGFYQDANGVTQLVTPEGAAYPTVEGMNAAGTVVGWYMPQDKDNVRSSGFIVQNGAFSRFDLAGIPDTRLMGVLEDGTLYGTYMRGKPLRATGFILRGETRTDLDVPGSYDTVVTGMNQSGRVVGYYQDAIGQPYKGFVWEAGQFTRFTLSAEGGHTYPQAIDDKGQVVGYVSNPDWSQASFVARPLKRAAP